MEFQIIYLFMIVSGFFVAWNTGANDAANCIGAAVGSNIISFRKGAILLGSFVFLGAVLGGGQVMETTGGGIVITTVETYEAYHGAPASEEAASALRSHFPDGRLTDVAIIVALLAAGFSVLMATLLGVPLSTAQCIVGGVAGAGIAVVGLKGEFFQLVMLIRIFGSWIISPILTMIVAFLAYKFLIRISQNIKEVFKWEKILAVLVLVSSCFFAFSLGSNAFGAGLGPLVMRFPEQRMLIAASAGLVLGIGAYTFGRRVTKTVGSDIATLDYAGALAAQFAAAMGLQVFSQWGVPVSSSQAIVGAVIGVGLVKGRNLINIRKIIQIFISWVLSPIVAAVLATIIYWIIMR